MFMNKYSFWISALLVCLMIFCVPTVHAAQDSHAHCVCGGSAVGVADHQCEDVVWQPLSSVVDLSKVDWKEVPSGNYYLDGEVIVTATTDKDAVGKISISDKGDTSTTDDDVYKFDNSKNLSICLNGHRITTSKDRVFKGVYAGSTLNICDCSGHQVKGIWQWEGTIVGGTSSAGGIAYTYANSTTNIYGGNITAKEGQTASSGGGLFYVAQDCAIGIQNSQGKNSSTYASSLNIYNGNLYGGASAKNGGNIYLAHCSILNMYGGSIQGGTATGKGGNIYCGNRTVLNLVNGTIYGGSPEAVHVITGNEMSQGYTVQDALKHVTPDSYLQLTRSITEVVTIPGHVTLDLNGYDLSGITVSGKLTVFDSKTDSYEGDHAGHLSYTLDGGSVEAKANYLAIEEESGTSFHKFYAGITHVTLNPGKAGLGYKATFAGDEAVQAQLADGTAYGYYLWREGYDPISRGYTAGQFGGLQTITLGLSNILSDKYDQDTNLENADVNIYAQAYIRLKDGRVLTGSTHCYNLKEVVHLVDVQFGDYSTTKQNAVNAMSAKFSQTMMSWDVENFHHAQGGIWEAVNAAQFKSKLIKNGSYQDVKPGTYVLTDDVDLTGMTMQIPSDTTVTICLNGHTISGNQRMFRIYGTLNLCDCHEHGETEGTITSSFANGVNTDGSVKPNYGAVFYTYYGSTFNLYGGNLKSTGQLTHAGVGAISHEKQGDANLKDIPAGVMNMYGGTLSGGNVTDKGGLLWVLHGASFNMYGGELYDGTASKSSAIYINEDSFADLQGGRIYNCGTNNIDLYYDHLTLGGNIQIEHINMSKGVKINMDNLRADAKVGLHTQYYGHLTNNTATKDAIILDDGQQVVEYNGKLLILESSVEEKALKSTFSVGHSQICINPAVTDGIPLSGYGNSSVRLSKGFEGEIYWMYANATAITDEYGETVLLITYDLQRPQNAILDPVRQAISEATGLPVDKIILSASHSHSTPDLYSSNELIREYKILLQNKLVQVAVEAMASRVPATMEASKIDEVRNSAGKLMNFSRHYYWYQNVGDGNGEYAYNYRNGTYYLGGLKNYSRIYWGDNFGTAPSTGLEKASLKHVTEGDHSMQLIRFVREGEKDVVLCNWAAHPHMTGGMDQYMMSSDYVGALRTAVQSQNDCYFSFIQGAAGNMNPTSRISGEASYTKDDYQAYGQELARIVTEQLTKMEDVATGKVQASQTLYNATVMKHSDEEVARAREFNELPLSVRKETYKDWGFTSIYHASSIVTKADLDAEKQLELNTFSIGNSIAFYTVPGELWSTAAQAVTEASPFPYTVTTGYANGDWKYFPDGEAADGTYENYEYFYCRFNLPDTTKKMIEIWQESLETLYS